MGAAGDSPGQGPLRGAPAGLALGLIAAAWLPLLLLADPLARPALCWPPVAAAGAVWCWVSARSRCGAPGLAWVLGGALLLRALVFWAAPQTSDDSLRYVWEALVLADGASPYAFAPSAPELAALRERWPELFAALNHPDTSAAYPPLYQAAASGVVALVRATGAESELVARSLLGLRLFTLGCDLLVIAALRRLLLATGRDPGLAVVWAWSPLAALEFAGAGHMDVLGILLWTAALAALVGAERAWQPGRSAIGLLGLCAATLVKYLPAVSLPFALRAAPAQRWRAGLAWVGLCALAFAPLLFLRGGVAGLFGGLSDYALRWESTSLLYRFVEWPLALALERDGSLLDPRRVGRALVVGLWLGVALRQWRRGAALLVEGARRADERAGDHKLVELQRLRREGGVGPHDPAAEYLAN